MINRTAPTVTVEQAAALMRPHRTKSIRLDRVWPPNEALGLLSQIGGEPNLPPSLDWPTIEFEDGTKASLDFLAQINLEELPEIEARGALPKTGMLYFFALAESNEPLQTYGSDAWRVLYYPGNAADFPSRSVPDDAGWRIDHLHYGETPGSNYRNPESPKGELFPRCTVRFTVIDLWDIPRFSGSDDPRLRPFEDAIAMEPADFDEPNGIPDAIRNFWTRINPFKLQAPKTLKTSQKQPPEARMDVDMSDISDLAYECLSMLRREEGENWYHSKIQLKSSSLPYRVEDAIMLLNEARNEWYENALPLEDVLEHWGESSDTLMQAYDGWKKQAMALTGSVTALGRATKLSPELREKVLNVVEEGRQLRKQAGDYGLHPHLETAFRASLTTLLTDFPGIAEMEPELVAAGNPANQAELNGYLSHCMLGTGDGLQSDLEDDAILLLQLCSDSDGPRFQWWDVGVIRFSINREALRTCDFHLAEAEIEGH
jgi:uncharacterized protein YwqG